MPDTISDLKRRLAESAEAVCRYYLFNGRRAGNYWVVGDVRNTPGRSLYVRLHGSLDGPGAAGRWRDAATGERGDLLNLIAATRGLRDMRAIFDEARRFLSLPPPESKAYTPTPAGSPEAARRLFAASKPIAGTLAEAYLHRRGIMDIRGITALRFHPNCYYRTGEGTPEETYTAAPALIAAVTALDGTIMGVQRTWLDPTGGGKLPIERPRRAMGHLLGHAVRFGEARDVMAAGEGIETVLSVRTVLPTMPAAAALSAGHLAALLFPPGLRRLYIIRDNDRAGHMAAEKLTARARAAGIEAMVLVPTAGDFNDDLRQLGPDALASALRVQLAPQDVARFWIPPSKRAGR